MRRLSFSWWLIKAWHHSVLPDLQIATLSPEVLFPLLLLLLFFLLVLSYHWWCCCFCCTSSCCNWHCRCFWYKCYCFNWRYTCLCFSFFCCHFHCWNYHCRCSGLCSSCYPALLFLPLFLPLLLLLRCFSVVVMSSMKLLVSLVAFMPIGSLPFLCTPVVFEFWFMLLFL